VYSDDQKHRLEQLWLARPPDKRTIGDVLAFFVWLTENGSDLLPNGSYADLYQQLHCVLSRHVVGSTPEAARRALGAWEALHDNGWRTTVVRNPDGTFAAWAAPNAHPVSVDAVEDCIENATLAALLALKRKTGHGECSPQCSGWELHVAELTESDWAGH
jgi:hypothetical protein